MFHPINTVPSAASVLNVQATCEVETLTITVSATPISVVTTHTSCVQSTQADYKIKPQNVTISYNFTTTVTVSQTPNSVLLDQCLKAEGSTTAWMVVAILFLIITISAIVLNVIMGYLLHKKAKTPKISSAAALGSVTKESAKEGTVSHSFSPL